MDWEFTLKGIFGVVISGFILLSLILLTVGTCDLRAFYGTLAICIFAFTLKVYNKWLACLEEDDATNDSIDTDD